MRAEANRTHSIEMQVQVQSSLVQKKEETARQIGSADYKIVAPLSNDKQESSKGNANQKGNGSWAKNDGAWEMGNRAFN